MRRTPKRLSVWAAGLIAAVILVAGCGGPSLPDREEAAGLSVRENPPSAAPTVRDVPAESPAIATESAAESAAGQGGGAGVTENGQPRQSEVPVSQPPSSAKPEAPSSPSPSHNATEKETRSSKPSPTEKTVASQASETPKASSEEASPSPSPVSSPKVDKIGAKGGGEPETLKFAELYGEVGVRGMKLSDKVQRLDGQKVEMTGFMAPPLSATVHFFVLTKVALTICPFCSTDADWPSDIVVVFMPEGKEIKPTEHQVRVTGTLSVGSQTDDETGFVSLIRIMADKTEVLK